MEHQKILQIQDLVKQEPMEKQHLLIHRIEIQKIWEVTTLLLRTLEVIS